jgi:tryptophan-rich sensory protein
VAVVFVAVCFAASGIGQLFGRAGTGAWYRELQKPSYTPPGWLFGPVWTALYIAMGLAAWLVWRRRGFRAAAVPLGLFALQLALNAAWTPLFFGLQRPFVAFVDIVALWVAIVLTAWCFFRASPAAGWLMMPYLAWVSFAAVLNAALWRLNA